MQFSRDSKYSRWYSGSPGNRDSHCFRQPPTHNVGRPSAAHIKRGEPPSLWTLWVGGCLKQWDSWLPRDSLYQREYFESLENCKVGENLKSWAICGFSVILQSTGPVAEILEMSGKARDLLCQTDFSKNAKVSRKVIFCNFWNFGESAKSQSTNSKIRGG